MSKELAAKSLYNTLCQTLDNMQWKYRKEEESLTIHTSAVGKDLSIPIMIIVDAERQVMYLKSPMPFAIPIEVRDTMAKAVTIANFTMLNGSFEFDMDVGFLAFKMVIPFMDSILSEEVCKYMIGLSCSMTDKFNNKFHAIAEGRMTIEDFCSGI